MSLFKLFIVINSDDDAKSSSLAKELDKFFNTNVKTKVTAEYRGDSVRVVTLNCDSASLLDKAINSRKLLEIVNGSDACWDNEAIRLIAYNGKFLSYNINWRQGIINNCRLIASCTFSRSILNDLQLYLLSSVDSDVLSFINGLKAEGSISPKLEYLDAISAIGEFHLLDLPTDYAKRLLSIILEECKVSTEN